VAVICNRMKLRIAITLTLLICGLFGSGILYGQQLNRQIDKSQKEAILISPFRTAKGMYNRIASQKRIRPQFLTMIDSVRRVFPNDTILLVEGYHFVYLDAPANYIQIQFGDNLFSRSVDFQTMKYKNKTESLSILHDDFNRIDVGYIYKLREEISTGDNWNVILQKYGTDKCDDGEHTFFTCIYPDGKIISMYMRCWLI